VFLDTLKMKEYTPKLVLEALLKSDKLLTDWDLKNHSHQISKQNYENERQQMEAYLKLSKNNIVEVSYKHPRHGWGRPYIYKSLGFTAFRKSVRNTLLCDNHLDFDISNAQPSILQNLCRIHKDVLMGGCPYNDYYCAHRDEVLQNISETYQVNKGMAKKLVLRLYFKGSITEWLKEFQIPTPTKHDAFIIDLKDELDRIAQQLKQHNPILYNTARKLKEQKKEKNYMGSFLALYLQEIEKRIVSTIIQWIAEETPLLKKKGVDGYVGAYEYDGLKLSKYNVEKYGKEKLLQEFHDKIKEWFDYDLNWDIKAIDGGYDLKREMLEIENEGVNTETAPALLDSEVYEFKAEFEDLILHNHVGIAEKVESLKPKNFIFHDEKWFCWNETKWIQSVAPLKQFIYYGISKYLLDKFVPLAKKYTDTEADNYKAIEKLKNAMNDYIQKKLNNETEVSLVKRKCWMMN
jgi:hypothetical protein